MLYSRGFSQKKTRKKDRLEFVRQAILVEQATITVESNDYGGQFQEYGLSGKLPNKFLTLEN